MLGNHINGKRAQRDDEAQTDNRDSEIIRDPIQGGECKLDHLGDGENKQGI
jgi:hypothetical protein